MNDKILRNAIRCKKCGDLLVSEHRHDFKICKCGACAVDGGHLYLRRCWDPKLGNSPEEIYDELSEYEKEG